MLIQTKRLPSHQNKPSNMSSSPASTPSGNKRSRAEIEHVPEGFKVLDNGRVVQDEYHKLELNKVPVTRVWVNDPKIDDTEETKFKVYVDVMDLSEADQEWLTKTNAAVKEAAEASGMKYSPLVNEGGQVKLTVMLKLQKRRKTALIKGGISLSGCFMLTSIYNYQGWYGLNLMQTRKDKKPTLGNIKAKKEDEDDGDDEQTADQ